ncbi:MAG: cbb3-type cytochrome c oxidase subunit II [Puniceicoccales bacterium]
MKNLPMLFLGIFFMLAFSWSGLILSSVIQYGDLKPIALEEGEMPMPQARVGMAQQGKEIYIDQGCLYCHSQQVRQKGFGADWERGWGDRQTVPRDYILQERVLLGTSRTGPDLTSIGQRQPSADWHHLHLFNPQITSPLSVMPPFRYLYRVQKIGAAPSPNALTIPDTFPNDQPKPGYEIVPTERAEQLVAYLLSLKLDYELPESRFAE